MISECVFCHETIDTNARAVVRKAMGWIDDNRKQGGANQIMLPERLPKWAHRTCVELIRDGVNPKQGTLI